MVIIDNEKPVLKEKSQIQLLTERVLELQEQLQATQELTMRILDLFAGQSDRLDAINTTLYQIAPEIEIIETMADSPEERQAMIDQYMNHNDYC